MRLTKNDQEKLACLYTEALGFNGPEPRVNYKKQAEKYDSETKAFLAAQTPGEPLKNADGSVDEGTVYLGDGVYLGKDYKGQDIIGLHGLVNLGGGDGTVEWSKYRDYSKTVPVTPEILKLAAANVGKL